MACYHLPIDPYRRETQKKRWLGVPRVVELPLASTDEGLLYGASHCKQESRAQEAICALIKTFPPATKSPGSLLPPFTGSLTFYQTLFHFVPNQTFHSTNLGMLSPAPFQLTAGFLFHNSRDSWSPSFPPSETCWAWVSQASLFITAQ